MKINNRLKARIIECFNTQADFAAIVGLKESRLSRIICNRTRPTSEEVKNICGALQCAPGELGL